MLKIIRKNCVTFSSCKESFINKIFVIKVIKINFKENQKIV